eukprot:TRINITY_DN27462_c0_g1_i2.p1 TRINITY_DN27462_c0_g1~~TRINITY_DN27462_c0_g1_i2.p1  ORF type:complete len:561 (-),score=71.20 TRINITY_DN27462_c0_g1_i2:66-1595(-)
MNSATSVCAGARCTLLQASSSESTSLVVSVGAREHPPRKKCRLIRRGYTYDHATISVTTMTSQIPRVLILMLAAAVTAPKALTIRVDSEVGLVGGVGTDGDVNEGRGLLSETSLDSAVLALQRAMVGAEILLDYYELGNSDYSDDVDEYEVYDYNSVQKFHILTNERATDEDLPESAPASASAATVKALRPREVREGLIQEEVQQYPAMSYVPLAQNVSPSREDHMLQSARIEEYAARVEAMQRRLEGAAGLLPTPQVSADVPHVLPGIPELPPTQVSPQPSTTAVRQVAELEPSAATEALPLYGAALEHSSTGIERTRDTDDDDSPIPCGGGARPMPCPCAAPCGASPCAMPCDPPDAMAMVPGDDDPPPDGDAFYVPEASAQREAKLRSQIQVKARELASLQAALSKEVERTATRARQAAAAAGTAAERVQMTAERARRAACAAGTAAQEAAQKAMAAERMASTATTSDRRQRDCDCDCDRPEIQPRAQRSRRRRFVQGRAPCRECE